MANVALKLNHQVITRSRALVERLHLFQFFWSQLELLAVVFLVHSLLGLQTDGEIIARGRLVAFRMVRSQTRLPGPSLISIIATNNSLCVRSRPLADYALYCGIL